MRKLSAIFFKGLGALLPIVVTLYLLYWMGTSAESVLGGVLQRLLPRSWYIPGMGLVAGLVLVFIVGVLLNAYLIRRLFALGEDLLEHIPLVKTIYGAAQDLMHFFQKPDGEPEQQVVLVRIPLGHTQARLVGFVTRRDFSTLPENLGGEHTIAVYLPMSYQVGGYTLMLPRDAVEPLDMTVDEAMRYALTAGMSTARRRPEPAR